MKEKTNWSSLKLLTGKSKSLLISLTIIFISLLGSVSLLIFTFGLPKIDIKIDLSRKYQPPLELNEFTNIAEVIGKQPTYKKDSGNTYYLVEIGNFNCKTCSEFHGLDKKDRSTFQKIKEDYIDTGKYNYSWIDFQNENGLKMHESFYCVLEQKPGKLFSYSNTLFFNPTMEVNKEKVENENVDMRKYDRCMSENKYINRIKSLTLLSQSIGAVDGESALYIIKIDKQRVLKQDDKIVEQKVPHLIMKLNGSDDYDKVIKDQLNEVIKNNSKV